MYWDDDLDLDDDFENKKFNPEMECTEKIAKWMIVPEISKLLKGFANKEKLNDLNYDFAKPISLYIKWTKNYQAAELVSKWDEQMVNDYVNFVINKVKNKDPKSMEYYKQMESLENNHKLPTKNGSPNFRVLSETIFRAHSRS